MKTPNSLDLTKVRSECFAKDILGNCDAMTTMDAHCGTYRCPFYKPEGCEDWIRIERLNEIYLIPPEEATWEDVMTEYTIKTNREEADAVVREKLSFIFRDEKVPVRENDCFGFCVTENGQTVRHPIDGMKFRATCVTKGAPLENGYVAVGFRRIS